MIINFGSLNVDIVMHVHKLPVPGDTILCPNYRLLAGGKGANQAAAASLSGSQVHMIGQVGDDEFGHLAIEALKKANVQTNHVIVDSIPTGCASISVDKKGENIITVASGANNFVSVDHVPDALLTPTTTLLLQMEINPEQNWKLLRKAAEKGCRTILNLAPARAIPPEALQNIHYLIMNEVEATLLGKDLKVPTSNLEKLTEYLAKKFDLTAIITCGSKGAIAYTAEGDLWKIPAFEVKAVDTTGAGDAFVGIFSAILEQGNPFEIALRYAIVGSGLCCTKQGAQPSLPSLQEIESALVTAPQPVLMTKE